MGKASHSFFMRPEIHQKKYPNLFLNQREIFLLKRVFLKEGLSYTQHKIYSFPPAEEYNEGSRYSSVPLDRKEQSGNGRTQKKEKPYLSKKQWRRPSNVSLLEMLHGWCGDLMKTGKCVSESVCKPVVMPGDSSIWTCSCQMWNVFQNHTEDWFLIL